MKPTKTAQLDAEKHALQVFEERNRAFRILYDTVMEVEGASDEAVFVILCRNLLRLCGGINGALATYHPAKKTMTLECACRRLNGEEVSFLDQPGITAAVTKETVEDFKKKQVQRCDQHRGCLVDIFSGSGIDELLLGPEGSCYRLSCVRDDELIVGGVVQLPPGTRLKLKDMIDTYLNLAGLIIQRIYIHRSVQESEGRLRTLFESMQPGLLLIDAETHRIVDVNSSAAGMIGLSRENIIGSICHRFVCPCEEGNCPITDQGKDVDREERILVKADGAAFPILKTVTPITMKGRPHLLESFIDITDLKEAQEALRQSESEKAIILNSLDELVSFQDRELRLIWANRAATDSVGLDQPRIHGRHCYEVWHQRSVPCDNCPVEAAIKTGATRESEVTSPDGTVWFIRGYPVSDEKGNIIGAVEITQNITERKQNEEALIRHSLVYRSMREAVLIFDCDDRIIDINQAAEKLLGWPREELLGKKVDILNPPDQVEEIVAGIRQGLDKNGVWEGELPMITRSGELRIMATIISSINDREGKWIGNVGINRDITLRKRLEEEVIKTQKLESLGILAGGLAHDFNNLLMSIMGNVSLSKLSLPEDTEIHQALDDAESSCIQARNLTQQLLTFARGGQPVKKSVFIGDLLRDSVGFALSGSNSKASLSISDDLWPVDVDTGQIHQVINNLSINATQAMPEGGSIEVGAENIAVTEEMGLPLKKGKHIRITFKDCGVGIPEKYIGKIFDPYFTTKKHGSGLGLATVYSIIKNHNGLISVTSEPKTGTVFSVYLPASDEIPVQMESRDREIVRGKGSILLMDDDTSVRTVSSRMLRNLGYDVTTASDGAEAVDIFRKNHNAGSPFDVVILDLTVKDGMGGAEAAREIKKIEPDARIIVTSGYSTDSIMADYERYGFCGVIVKPYKIKDLGALMSRVIPGRTK